MDKWNSINANKYFFFIILLQTVSPIKKLKTANGAALVQQPKNTVAMLNELRQGLVYNLESQSGQVHAPVFTMSVEVCSRFPVSTFFCSIEHFEALKLFVQYRSMVKSILGKAEVKKSPAYKRRKRHYEISYSLKTVLH